MEVLSQKIPLELRERLYLMERERKSKKTPPNEIEVQGGYHLCVPPVKDSMPIVANRKRRERAVSVSKRKKKAYQKE